MLFHVLALAILEIIFYFEYIGPLETDIFKNSFLDIVSSFTKSVDKDKIDEINLVLNNEIIENSIKIILFGNDSTIEFENSLENSKNEAINYRNNYNLNLYNNCILYWFITTIIISMLFIVLYIYFNKKKSSNEDYLTEMVELRSRVRINSMHEENNSDVTEEINSNINEENTIILPRNNLLVTPKDLSIKYKIVYYVVLSGLILLFEYLFFTNIVMEYKILTIEEVKYYTYNELKPWIINNFSV